MKTGKNVKISPRASFYNCDNITIGDNVRIDDFCILSGGAGITIGSHIHIAAYTAFYGGAGIVLEDFVEISTGIMIFSQSDDFAGGSLVGPCIPMKYKPTLKSGLVTLKKHVLLGSGVVVLPGVTVGEGVSVGALSLVNRDCSAWGIYAGVPARRIGLRSDKMLAYEKEFLKEYDNG